MPERRAETGAPDDRVRVRPGAVRPYDTVTVEACEHRRRLEQPGVAGLTHGRHGDDVPERGDAAGVGAALVEDTAPRGRGVEQRATVDVVGQEARRALGDPGQRRSARRSCRRPPRPRLAWRSRAGCGSQRCATAVHGKRIGQGRRAGRDATRCRSRSDPQERALPADRGNPNGSVHRELVPALVCGEIAAASPSWPPPITTTSTCRVMNPVGQPRTSSATPATRTPALPGPAPRSAAPRHRTGPGRTSPRRWRWRRRWPARSCCPRR